jgi:hypothetical protein
MGLIDHIGPVAGKIGRPRQRPEALYADRGYDHDKYRRLLWSRGVKALIRAAAPSTARALEKSAGSSSAPSPGCTTSAACGPAMNATAPSTKPSSSSAPRSSANATSPKFSDNFLAKLCESRHERVPLLVACLGVKEQIRIDGAAGPLLLRGVFER